MSNLPNHEAIVEYWQTRVYEQDLGTDWDEATHRCWRCGTRHSQQKSTLERCHIIPASLGGPDTVDNLVLLCCRCHEEAPNINCKTAMWDWIKATKVPLYNTYWTLRSFEELKKIYGVSIEQLTESLLQQKQKGVRQKTVIKNFCKELESLFEGSSYHFGGGGLNESTNAILIYQTFQHLINQGKENKSWD